MIKTQITCCLPSSFLLLLEESGWVVLSRRMVKVKIAQSCLDSLRAHGQSMEFSRPRYWSGSPFPSPGDLPNLGVEPRSPALRADSLPAETPGKPKNTGVGSLSLLQGISQPRNRCLILSNCFSASIKMTLLCFIFSSLVS